MLSIFLSRKSKGLWTLDQNYAGCTSSAVSFDFEVIHELLICFWTTRATLPFCSAPHCLCLWSPQHTGRGTAGELHVLLCPCTHVCDTVPFLQYTQTQVSCTVGSLPTAKETKLRKKQHQGKSEGSWKRDRSSVNVMPSGSIWHLSGFPSVLHKIISEDCNNNKNLQQRLRAGERVPLFLIYFALL